MHIKTAPDIPARFLHANYGQEVPTNHWDYAPFCMDYCIRVVSFLHFARKYNIMPQNLLCLAKNVDFVFGVMMPKRSNDHKRVACMNALHPHGKTLSERER